ncbi:hypothetical protein F8388_019743 [Cannabis sativa]|uniref:CCT domain-containing protein n=1 Tax=Cannabis sativa TaxID=3483 RepID=A0A7J6ED20_CANSA|nr:hypothetical protein F8388_019743 [Cannabis sativa]
MLHILLASRSKIETRSGKPGLIQTRSFLAIYDKHIRYESRKARADTRRRVKGQFVKATEAAPNS